MAALSEAVVNALAHWNLSPRSRSAVLNEQLYQGGVGCADWSEQSAGIDMIWRGGTAAGHVAC